MTEENGIGITEDAARVSPEALAALYESVGFGVRSDYLGRPDLLEKMFGPGCFGFFALEEAGLVGLVRVFSDDLMCAWIAELCVRPDRQKQGIGTALLERVLERFSHTAIYAEAFAGQEDFLARCGLKPRPILVACSRAPTA